MKLKTKWNPTDSDLDWTRRMLKVTPEFQGQSSGLIFKMDRDNKIVTLIRLPKGKIIKDDAARFKKACEMCGWSFKVDIDKNFKEENHISIDLNKMSYDPFERLKISEFLYKMGKG
jgi:hypothetical protein